MREETVGVTDYYKLAVLDLHRVPPVRSEHSGRYWAYYKKADIKNLLEDYENGRLKVIARDYVAAVQRTKSKIFESERVSKAEGNYKNDTGSNL